jgi:hypothetical protein
MTFPFGVAVFAGAIICGLKAELSFGFGWASTRVSEFALTGDGGTG